MEMVILNKLVVVVVVVVVVEFNCANFGRCGAFFFTL